MPSSGYFDATFSGHPFTLRLNLAVASQDISANQSTVNWNLQIISVAGYTPYRTDSAPTWSYNYYGSGHFGPYSFNGSAGQTITIASGTFVVTHASDGTYTLSNTFSANAMSTITTASGSGSMALPTIPRATQPTVSPTSGNTDSTYAIGTVPASSGFYHDIYYSLDGGTTLVSIVSNQVGTTTSTNWTPASTLLPNATGVTAIISVDTRNSSGGTIIGTKTVSLPLTVPTSIVPTISSVAWVDTQTSAPDMPTLMGAAGRFVQAWSKLQPTVTDAGASGSTIVSASVSQGGQVAPSGTAFTNPVTLSGAAPFTATAIDSRGRSSVTYSSTVAVTAYNFPSLPTPTVTRTSDSAGLIPASTGTYLAITPAASTSSLNFSGEKNLLEWQVRTRPAGGSWTTIQAWTNATVSGTTWTTKYVAAGPYLSSLEYEVEVSIRDLFGKNGYNTGSTIVVLTVPVPSESVFMDWDGTTGIGLGQYRSNGMLDVAGNIYQGGNLVLDTSDLATDAQAIAGTSTTVAVTPHALAAVATSTTQAGLVELATDAETITGTDAARAVTPHALTAKLALPIQGQVPSSVVVGSGSASVAADGTVTFTGVSSLSLNGIFDGLGADMYQWYMSPQSSISVVNILARFRAAGTDLASTSYGATYHGYSGGVAGSQTAGTTLSALYAGYALNTANLVSCSFGIINKPKTATYKTMQSLEYSPNYVNYDMGSYTTSLTLYDGITFFVTSGTISGQVKIVKVA